MNSLEKNAQENDGFRQNVCGAELEKSPEILELSQAVREDIYYAIRMFDTNLFEQNQHPKHDFGVVNVQGQRINWCIEQLNNEQNVEVAKRKMTVSTVTETIARLNDSMRKLGIGGRVLITQGIQGLGSQTIETIMMTVRFFDDFTEGNDPDGERDFGSLAVCGQRIFWKIDYYDKAVENGSDEPADSSITERVLTVMLANEY
jgi:hypothetical protein